MALHTVNRPGMGTSTGNSAPPRRRVKATLSGKRRRSSPVRSPRRPRDQVTLWQGAVRARLRPPGSSRGKTPVPHWKKSLLLALK